MAIPNRPKPPGQPEGFGSALAYIALGLPRTPGKKPFYSYQLKHEAQGWHGSYVSVDAMVAAARAYGWTVKRDRANLNDWLWPPPLYVRRPPRRLRGRRHVR